MILPGIIEPVLIVHLGIAAVALGKGGGLPGHLDAEQLLHHHPAFAVAHLRAVGADKTCRAADPLHKPVHAPACAAAGGNDDDAVICCLPQHTTGVVGDGAVVPKQGVVQVKGDGLYLHSAVLHGFSRLL